jgi:hypothetical protein
MVPGLLQKPINKRIKEKGVRYDFGLFKYAPINIPIIRRGPYIDWSPPKNVEQRNAPKERVNRTPLLISHHRNKIHRQRIKLERFQSTGMRHFVRV